MGTKDSAVKSTRADDDGEAQYEQFLVFGDSITQFSNDQRLGFGFSAALQNEYARSLDVINRGFSGYNTANAVKVFLQFYPPAERARIRLMTIFFGANDAVLPKHDQHVPLDQYKRNLKAIIEQSATKGQSPKILILTPPPIDEYQLEDLDRVKNFDSPSRTADNTKQYADACREVAKSSNLPVADIWTAFMEAAGWKKGETLAGSKKIPQNEVLASLLCDGLHFTGEGYKVMYHEVMRVIRDTWPDQVPEKLGKVFPDWRNAPK